MLEALAAVALVDRAVAIIVLGLFGITASVNCRASSDEGGESDDGEKFELHGVSW